MADIALRFHKDMLVLSSPIRHEVAQIGLDSERDLNYMATFEPEPLRDALRMNIMGGVPVLVAPLEGLTPARLAHQGNENEAAALATEVVSLARKLKPQHLLLEIGPCGLPLDPDSKASLNESKDQYARAGRACEGLEFDAFFLNGFENITDLKCALMGLRQVSDGLIFAALTVDEQGNALKGGASLEEAVAMMSEYGAAVVGFATKAGPEAAVELTKRAVTATDRPILVELIVGPREDNLLAPNPDNPYPNPDALVAVAGQLQTAGAQFLRAEGQATPSYAAAMVVAVGGQDVNRPDIED